jgi:hypothetical protein
MVAYGPSVGSTLASDADRERAVDVLRAGFAEGRLTQPEFTERIARVQSSRTYDQLAELTRDLQTAPWTAGTTLARARNLAAEVAEPSFMNVALTAVVVFTLAAIVTALAVYAHIHGHGQIYLQPYIVRAHHP